MQITFKATMDKQTKGTIRYKEDGDDPKVGFVYIKKPALPSTVPQAITVTIDAV